MSSHPISDLFAQARHTSAKTQEPHPAQAKHISNIYAQRAALVNLNNCTRCGYCWMTTLLHSPLYPTDAPVTAAQLSLHLHLSPSLHLPPYLCSFVTLRSFTLRTFTLRTAVCYAQLHMAVPSWGVGAAHDLAHPKWCGCSCRHGRATQRACLQASPSRCPSGGSRRGLSERSRQ